MRIKLYSNNEQAISILIVSVMAYNIITASVNSITNIFAKNTPIDTAICMALFACIVIYALPTIIRRIDFVSVGVLVLFCLLFIIAATDQSKSEYVSKYFSFFLFSTFPFFILGRSVRNVRSLYYYFQRINPWIIVIAGLCYLIKFTVIGFGREEDMAFSYSLLPFTIFALIYVFEKFTFKRFLLFLLGFAIHFLSGTRGPIVCIAISVVLIVIFGSFSKWTKMFAILFCGLIIVFLNSQLFLQTMYSLSGLLGSSGASTRIIQKLLSEELLSDSNRSGMSTVIIEAIQNRPFTGYGFLGDRCLIIGHEYPHNIVLEIVCQFGIPFGSILLFLFYFYPLRKMIRNRELRNLFIVLISSSLVKLLFSGTYITEQPFFLLLGFSFNNYIILNHESNVITES